MLRRRSYNLLFGSAFWLACLFAGPAEAAPKITWTTPSLVHTLETGKFTTLTVTFSVSEKVNNLDVEVEVVPALAPFVTVSPTSFESLAGGESHDLQILLTAPLAFPPGVYTGTLKLGQVSGGTAAKPLPIEFTITADIDIPVVTIDDPADGSVFGADDTVVTLAGTLDDPFASLAVDGQPVAVADGVWTHDVTLTEGINFITAVATDQVGLIGTAAVELTLDTNPPVVAIDLPADGAVVHDATIAVAGLINDIVAGTVGGAEASVTVNGVAAEVGNRSFLATGIALVAGANTITTEAVDAAGNTASASITVSFQPLIGVARIFAVSGDGQQGQIAGTLAAPLVAELRDDQDAPVEGVVVIFKVVENNGTVTNAGETARGLAVTTDAFGQAQVDWTLGSRAGAGNNQVTATAVGFTGAAVYHAISDPGAPFKLVLDDGNNQTGATGQPLAGAFVVVVTDVGHNRIEDVPVTFEVVEGEGRFNEFTVHTVVSDSQGRAVALLKLGAEEGIENNVVTASFPGNPNEVVTFVASAKVAGDPALTAITGVVLDNTDAPVAGVTLSVAGTALAAVSDAQGQFTIPGAPVGAVLLIADGATAPRPGVWPRLEFELVTVAGRAVDLGMPIFMLPLEENNLLCVDATTGGTLTLPAFPGFALTVAPGSASFPGGADAGCIGVTVVHADKVPMTPNFGQQPRFIVTIQPAGAHFDPPAALSLPNSDGLVPGEITEMYSFDHDLGQFVAIGTGTVAEDGLTITSDSGVGVIKAGWHCAGNPSATGTCEPVSVRITTQGSILLAPGIVGATGMITAQGTPGEGSYSWTSSDGAAIEFVSGQTAATVTIRLLEPKEVTLRVSFTAESGAPSNVATIQVIPVAMKLEQVGLTVISEDEIGRFTEDTTVRVTAVNASTNAGATLTSFTGNVLIAEQSEMAIYSQNGGTLPLFVSITAGGTATFEANSLAGPKDEDGDLPPDPAKIVTTNFPVFQASETETAFLPIPQWVDNGVFLPMVTGLGFDWFEKQMIAILGPIVAEGGDLDEVMRQIFQIEVVGLPVDVLGRVDLDHRSTSTVLIDPFFNSARINAIPGLIICGKVIGNHLTNVLTDIPHIPSKFVEIVPLSHRQGNCIPYAAIRWHDFGNRPALGRPLGHFSRHPDTPLLSLSPRRRFPRPTPERVFVADHQSSSGFSGTGPSAPPPQPIGT